MSLSKPSGREERAALWDKLGATGLDIKERYMLSNLFAIWQELGQPKPQIKRGKRSRIMSDIVYDPPERETYVRRVDATLVGLSIERRRVIMGVFDDLIHGRPLGKYAELSEQRNQVAYLTEQYEAMEAERKRKEAKTRKPASGT